MPDEDMDKIIILIDEATKRKFQMKCIENGTNMSKVLREFIIQYISEGEADDDGTATQ